MEGKAIDGKVDIPDRQYFKIGEVSEITGVEPHVLRYWEGEFKEIRPQRAGSRQRLFRRVDVETILRIKQLLHGEGFTIAGAKKALAKGKSDVVATKSDFREDADFVRGLKAELVALKALLEKE
ncbi:MAG: MerR family transcriptional regulator [Desulfobulbaceae bacterium]|nr:MerR family transcriptional regulator [Desulfobulbaceae bacterium]